MRKALIAATSFVLFIAVFANVSYSKDENHSLSALKYNYVVETDLTLTEFSHAFFERLKTKHKWNEVSGENCESETCSSSWRFKDDDANEWKCDVVIKKAYDEQGANKMLVTMEMNAVLGS